MRCSAKCLHGEKPAAQIQRFEVFAKACGFRSGVDLLRLNQLSDELGIEDFQRKSSGGIALDGPLGIPPAHDEPDRVTEPTVDG